MTKVLFISYYFPPVGGSGVLRAQKFVEFLPQMGFIPTVVAGPALLKDRWGPNDPTLSAILPSNVQVHRVDGPPPPSVKRLSRRLRQMAGAANSFREMVDSVSHGVRFPGVKWVADYSCHDVSI